jgi:DNA-binding MarR family transcriptional regulator
MSLENDIQSKFRSEHHKIMVNLIYTYNWAMEKSKRFFEKADLTPQQFNILRILRGSGKPLSTMQIRQRMLDRMSDTSRIVDRLLKKELVQKVVCNEDRRLVDITISEKGMKLLQELDNYNDEMDALLSSINEEEAKTLNRLLDKLRGSV